MVEKQQITSFRGRYRFLSNFWVVSVIYEGIRYPSVEHAYQAAKTLSKVNRRSIAMAPTAGKAKRLGRSFPLRSDWDNIKLLVMRQLLEAKFKRHELRLQLLATGDAELIEGNTWGDRFWGVCDGWGENWLGRLLMTVREELRNG